MLLFTDGCDSYAATADLMAKWASNSSPTNITFSAAGGKFGGGAISMAGAGFLVSPTLRTTGNDTFCISFWMKASTKPTGGQPLLFFMDATADTSSGSGSYNDTLAISTVTGALGWRGWAVSSGGYTIGPTNVCDNQWHWIEVYHKSADTGGRIKLYIDGLVEFDFTGDTVYGSVGTYGNCNLQTRIALSGSTGSTILIDDLIVWDNVAGSTGDLLVSNFPLGQCKIETLRPSASGNSAQFTASSGSNYACVNETSPNGDTNYVSTSTTGLKDSYAFTDLSATPTTIYGVMVNTYAKNNGTGTINIAGLARSSGVESTATAVATGAAYKTFQYNFPQDPNTSAAWTGAGVNAAEFGFKSS